MITYNLNWGNLEMSLYKICTLKHVGFWQGLKTVGCSVMEKAQIEHTYKALEIVAEAVDKDISDKFKEFYKECTYLRALCGWDSDIEEVEEEVEEEKVEETEEEVGEVEEFDTSEALMSPKKLRFIEIMLTDYNQITEEMKEEAIKLFPKIICSVGNVGEDVYCDSEEVI